MIAHAWGGRDNFVEEKAIDLAKEGFVAMAIDMYGDGKQGTSVEENQSLMTPLVEDRDKLKSIINAALERRKKSRTVSIQAKVAAIGYCFGGLVVLDLARSGADVKGVVSFPWIAHGF